MRRRLLQLAVTAGLVGCAVGWSAASGTAAAPVGTRAHPVPVARWAELGGGWQMKVTRVSFDARGLIAAAGGALPHQIDQVTCDGCEGARRLPAVARLVAVEITARYRGPATSRFHARTRLRLSGRNGAAYPLNGAGCGRLPRPELLASDPQVFSHSAISGWAACWDMRAGDAKSLLLSARAADGRLVWFRLR